MHWRLSLCLLGALGLASSSYAAPVHTATACTPTAVQAAVDAAHAGDTVQLPTCDVNTWNATVTVTKSVHIKGNGVNNTKIKHTVNGHHFKFGTAMPASLANYSICCMTLEGRQAGTEQLADKGLHLLNGVDFRVHNMVFTHLGMGIEVNGDPTVMRGVIDNNHFFRLAKYQNGVLGYGLEVRGNGTYPALALGGATNNQNTFIEDNIFEEVRHAVASVNGSRYVFRHNTVRNARENTNTVDAHGKFHAWPRGSRQYEIYNNVLSMPNGLTRFAGIGIRGGDGVIFGNTISGYTRPIAIWNEDAGESEGYNCTWPCADQIRSLHVSGNTPNTVQYKNADAGWATILQEGRDYFLFARPGYVAFTYPHPLRGEGGGGTPPGPPQLVHITPIF